MTLTKKALKKDWNHGFKIGFWLGVLSVLLVAFVSWGIADYIKLFCV